MLEKDFIMVQVPGREDASIQFTVDKGVNNDSAYPTKYVRRIAWALTQALPMHVIEHLIYELMVLAQETIVRGARIEGAMKGKRLVIAVQDTQDSPFPAPLQLWYDNGGSAPVAGSIELEDEVEVDTDEVDVEGDDDE